MTSQEGSRRSSPTPISPPPTSFVYPTKSLLSGRVQPAEEDAEKPRSHSPKSSSDNVATTPSASEDQTGTTGNESHLHPARPREAAEADPTKPDESPLKLPFRPQNINLAPQALVVSHSQPPSPSALLPNYRHYPAEDRGNATFISNPAISDTLQAPELVPSGCIAQALVASPSVFEPYSTSSGAAFSSSKPWDSDLQQLSYRLSEYGIVHLPPLPLNLPRASPDSEIPDNISEESEYSSLDEESNTNSATEPTSVAEEEKPLVTFRYTYAQDEHGNHVVLGREGKLQRCEDEPIRTPGAIQGFGVLVVVEEKEDMLPVRQVSENATEILGLSPNYLFSLECFTDILSDSQAGLLWDNIQCLPELGSPGDYQDAPDSPSVFLLSGFGESGSALAGQPRDDMDRRKWACWCAIHRPASHNAISGRPLIIIELELEIDRLNPLYPAQMFAGTPLSETGPLSPPSSNAISPNSSPGNIPEREDVTEQYGTIAEPLSPPTSVPANPPPPSFSRLSSIFWEISESSPHSIDAWSPIAMEDIVQSTTSYSKPLAALERIRKMAQRTEEASDSHSRRSRRRKGGATSSSTGVDTMQVLAVMTQINTQLGEPQDLESLLKVVVGIMKDLTQFHRVMVYQFDEAWNGKVVAELVDWSKTHDLYRGLHFPAGDIPAQARALYAINQVRILYDRGLPTARLVVRRAEDLDPPLDMTHSYLRAMSPIHLKYLENMDVRASMSVSIMAFGQLWGLISCHSYGPHGMRVPFPVRQMLRLVSQAVSRNIERLSYSQRLQTRKLINTMLSDRHPSGYIVSDGDELLNIFDADFGILVVGEGAKIMGTDQHGQEILLVAEYLRFKKYRTIRVSQALSDDFPDLKFSSVGIDVVAGLLYVPLSNTGKDFIVFLRKGQIRNVHWAGKPQKESKGSLEPRKSFKIWSETVAGRCRVWTDDQLETAGVLALVYGKFIEVWRQKESALRASRLTNILLTNASHDVRTPLNQIINYLELALNGPLDEETRNNLAQSHSSSKSLLFTINDLLDLTRLESGNELSVNDPFDLPHAINQSVTLYKSEAERRNIRFNVNLNGSPRIVVGDAKKIRAVVQNLTANALKFTTEGFVNVSCSKFEEPEGLRGPGEVAVEIVVEDTGSGMPPEKLERIFRELEEVDFISEGKAIGDSAPGIGLGLAVVARMMGQMNGQLRVESQVDKGTKFSCFIPLSLPQAGDDQLLAASAPDGSRSQARSRSGSASSKKSALDHLVDALSGGHLDSRSSGSWNPSHHSHRDDPGGGLSVEASVQPVSHASSLRIQNDNLETSNASQEAGQGQHHQSTQQLFQSRSRRQQPSAQRIKSPPPRRVSSDTKGADALRILIVEDNDVNRAILAKRLKISGHDVVGTTNGQEGLDKVISDRAFDAILMDIQMPILNGFEAAQKIREFEKANPLPSGSTSTASGSGATPSYAIHGHIPIFAVSASLKESQREEMIDYGMDGWILKPIDFKRLKEILGGIMDLGMKQKCLYVQGCNWEIGGWLV